MNVSLKAENLPNDTSVALAGFINVACNTSSGCNQEQNDGTGITDYVMEANETVVVWALCQGVASWDVNLMITAEFYVPDEVASNGLTGGAIAGIVIGSVVGGIFILAFAYKYLRCKSNQTMSLPQESPREGNNNRHDTEGKAGDAVDYLPQAPIHPAPKEGMLSIDQDASSSALGATGSNLLQQNYSSNAALKNESTLLPEIHRNKASAAKGWKELEDQTEHSGGDQKHDNERA